jgi:hypothetical protein
MIVSSCWDQVTPHPYPPPSRGRNLFGLTHIFPSPGGRGEGEGEGEKSPSVRTTFTPMPISDLPGDRARQNVKGLLGHDTSNARIPGCLTARDLSAGGSGRKVSGEESTPLSA